ncbi:hypothetical protein GF366_03065 [Candidatus Peregrinibacteria bacterium]|nr:hypothetical protein [Candidatus Peregrinibacteria bacterium]
MKFPRKAGEGLEAPAVTKILINQIMREGKFITIYGINNIGKTTQAHLLVDRLKDEGYKSYYVKYPVYDVEPSGSFINDILRGREEQKISEDELQMWYVINRYQFQPKLINLLEEGYVVIAEDYAGTGIAWGTAKGLEEEWVETINSKVLKEDLAILMEGKRQMDAVEEKHVHEQNKELIEKCEKIHSHLAEKYDWKRVKVQKKIEGTAENLWKIVKKSLVDVPKK